MTDTAQDIAHVFIDRIAAQHGFPKEIISDCDSKFTSTFCNYVNFRQDDWDLYLPLVEIAYSISTSKYQVQLDHL
jgi:hypothetical protein